VQNISELHGLIFLGSSIAAPYWLFFESDIHELGTLLLLLDKSEIPQFHAESLIRLDHG
jgi:hypothetical protein